MAGIIPFGAVVAAKELIFSTISTNEFYYLLSLMFILFCMLVVSCAQTSIIITYFYLLREVKINIKYCLHIMNRNLTDVYSSLQLLISGLSVVVAKLLYLGWLNHIFSILHLVLRGDQTHWRQRNIMLCFFTFCVVPILDNNRHHRIPCFLPFYS